MKSIGRIQQEAEDMVLVKSDVLLKERESNLTITSKVQSLVDPFHKFQEGTAASLGTSKQFNIGITLHPIAIGFTMSFGGCSC